MEREPVPPKPPKTQPEPPEGSGFVRGEKITRLLEELKKSKERVKYRGPDAGEEAFQKTVKDLIGKKKEQG